MVPYQHVEIGWGIECRSIGPWVVSNLAGDLRASVNAECRLLCIMSTAMLRLSRGGCVIQGAAIFDDSLRRPTLR